MASRFHRTCHLCGEPNLSGALVCQSCTDSLMTPPPIMNLQGIPLMVAGFYESPLSLVMSAYKDHEDLSSLLVLYHLLSRLPRPRALSSRAVIVPVPTTDDRLVARGFYPVLTLAKFLSYHWQIPLWRGIGRHQNDTHQRGLDRSARLSNVKDDFYLASPLSASQVVLFDDVVTTGATIEAMSEAIRTKYPKVKPIAVGVLHGKKDLHLPVYGA